MVLGLTLALRNGRAALKEYVAANARLDPALFAL